MKRLRILTFCSCLLALCLFAFKKDKPSTLFAGEGLVINKAWLISNKNPVSALKDIRPADQTFLTYPEWYLVFSPEEQANYFRTHTSTGFPYSRHTAQIWQGYQAVCDQIKGNFPYNAGYHFMIWVIGTSASVEYSTKSIYETTIGRITDTHQVITDEDKFNARYTQDYVDFIKDRPWYEFDFKSRLSSLWTQTSFFGTHFFRKLERKYFLTTELLVKIVYGKLIGLGTKSVYEEAVPTTAVLVDSIPINHEGIKPARTYADKSAILYLPRYDKFTPALCLLAEEGMSFREIAGNNSAILLSLIVPSETTLSVSNMQVIFTQPFASDPAFKRVAVVTPVHSLSGVLHQLKDSRIKIEHIFDY